MSLLTSKLSDEDRKKAHELFGVPEQFDEVADLMVHEEEWQVILSSDGQGAHDGKGAA